jgi:two-component system, NarL family, nitrate/nitrite response regulator NarL
MTRNPSLPLASLDKVLDLDASVRVVVVTEDPLLRRGLISLLAQDGHVSVVEERAEVVLWDPGTDGERALARMREIKSLGAPAVAVIAGPEHLGPALAAGARGVVLRGEVGPELGAALTAVKRGLTVIDTSLSSALIAPIAGTSASASARPADPHRRGGGELTERERQVVALLTEGLSNKLIADRLGISDHTAKFHVNGVMAKLGAGTRTEAVVEAVRRGLVTL